MVVNLVKRSFIGLGFSAIITFIALTILLQSEQNIPISVIWSNMLSSMILGIYYGCSSFIFEIEKWSPLKQTIIHFILSFAIWLPIAIITGWVPLNLSTIFIGVIIFTVLYLLTWYGHFLYFKKVENDMNNLLKK